MLSRAPNLPNMVEVVERNTTFGMGKGKVFPAESAQHLLNPLRRLIQPPMRIVSRMNLKSDSRVLEFGCGPGWFSPSIARAVPHGHLTLCDIQPEMLAIAVSRIADTSHVDSVVSDGRSLPFDNDRFDAILLAAVIGELPDPMILLRECARVLSPGGTVTVVETRRDSDFIRRRDLVEMMQSVDLHKSAVHGNRWEYTINFTSTPPLSCC